MMKIFIFLLSLLLCVLTQASFAQETAVVGESAKVDSAKAESTEVKSAEIENQQPESGLLTLDKTPQVGKHVMANMNASSMILSLLMVLGVIIISALVLKRFNLTQQNSNQLKVVASLSLGAKERVVVVQIGEQQLVLGVCPQQISLLKNLETPIDIQAGRPLALSGNVLSFLQKNSIKSSTGSTNDTDSRSATSETTNNK